ncbi:PAS domain-containing protein [Enterovibrio sp. Hal110]
MDGTIRTANDNFLNAMGYTSREVQGRHHSMFVDPEYSGSAEYKAFWEKLNRGEFESAEFKRFGKGVAKCGYKPRITRSLISTATRLKSSNMPRTLPRKNARLP